MVRRTLTIQEHVRRQHPPAQLPQKGMSYPAHISGVFGLTTYVIIRFPGFGRTPRCYATSEASCYVRSGASAEVALGWQSATEAARRRTSSPAISSARIGLAGWVMRPIEQPQKEKKGPPVFVDRREKTHDLLQKRDNGHLG